MRYLTILCVFLGLLQAENIEITAQNFQADEQKGYTEFTGKVNILKQASELNASRVIVFFDENRTAKRYEAYGDVSFFIKENNSTYRGQSQELVFYPNENKYHFAKDVKLYDVINDRTIIGEQVDVDTKQGKADVKGSEQKPVKFIFEVNDGQKTDNQ